MIFSPYGIGLLQAQRMQQQPQLFPPAASPQFGVPGQVMPQQPMLRQTSFVPGLPAAAPMAAAQVPQAQPAMQARPQPPAAAPQQQPAAVNKPPGARPPSQGVFGIDPQTWFDIAGGFAAGAQNNDWSQALFGIGGALDARRGRQDAQMERKFRTEEQGFRRAAEGRAAAAEGRDQARFGREEEDAQFVREQRAGLIQRYNEMRADPNLSPQDQMTLAAMGPEGFADFMMTRYQTQAQEAQAAAGREHDLTLQGNEFQFRRTENAADRAARRAEVDAATPYRSPYYAQPNARDQQSYQQFQVAAQSGEQALAGLQNARRLLLQLGEMGAMGQPLDAAQRMRISRLIGDNQEARALYEQFMAEQWPLVVQSLQGLAPVSNVEIGMAQDAAPGVDDTLSGAIQTIDSLIARTQRTVDLSYTGMDWGANAGSYSTGRDAEGRTWADVQRSVFAPTPQQTQGAADETAMRGGPDLGATISSSQLRAITSQDPRSIANGTVLTLNGVQYRIEQLRGGTRAVRVQ